MSNAGGKSGQPLRPRIRASVLEVKSQIGLGVLALVSTSIFVSGQLLTHSRLFWTPWATVPVLLLSSSSVSSASHYYQTPCHRALSPSRPDLTLRLYHHLV